MVPIEKSAVKIVVFNNFKALGVEFTNTDQNFCLEVIKNGTTDMYQAFLVAHAFETAVKDKKKNNGNGARTKISEMDACFDDDIKSQVAEKIA